MVLRFELRTTGNPPPASAGPRCFPPVSSPAQPDPVHPGNRRLVWIRHPKKTMRGGDLRLYPTLRTTAPPVFPTRPRNGGAPHPINMRRGKAHGHGRGYIPTLPYRLPLPDRWRL